jgi:hypothetical protein
LQSPKFQEEVKIELISSSYVSPHYWETKNHPTQEVN